MTTGLSKLRVLNDRAALSHILRAGEVSRSELEELTGLSKPATAELLNRLESAGLVHKLGMRSGGPGPKAQLWGVRPEVGFAAGVNVTPGSIQVTITDLSGTVVASCERAEDPSASAAVREALRTACELAAISADQILHAVIGLPGALDPRSGLLRFAPHMPAWSGYDLLAALETELGLPATVENDVNLMALAELDGGLAAEVENFALIWIDAGLGAAIVLRRELFRGLTGGAGEIDYLPVPDRAVAETGGDRRGEKFGNLLSPAAISALSQAYGLPPLEPSALVAQACREEDHPAFAGFLDDLAVRIATGLAAIVTVLDPELLLLGGSIGVAGGQRLADLVRSKFGEVTSSPPDSIARVSALSDSAGDVLAGATSLALKRAREKAFETGSILTS
ncbi:ROK family transcriptional regulator [Psychromicrobium xiongbiense]|uniref:ROK family transcriptional regulator n=1 Tax=Psychromicrobium xiongbiense TaxID=3051184 RepID=UPI00255515F3|nr:ROK family transcriptional regulator [Psychromicrobium sp. YIM S02556]